ncbi:Spy/CpxP family protein refolding chaperone [Microbulbifer sp. SAOS-129_SWC]|uniref:Spy/CpxP family protein refolding chaperone n=1 Tax=Microbulbifer sp. SAOS-129_SWC TaxID=3145235 RepID=UPI0032170ED2
MKQWKVIAGSVVLAGVMAAPVAVLAQDGDKPPMRMWHHGMQGGHFFERMADELNLTEGQKAQLKANREANRAAAESQREEMRKLHQQLREALDSGADQATLDSLGAKLGKLEVARMQEMQKMRQQFDAILTDEQKAKLKQRKAEHEARWKARSERRQQDDE